MPRRRVLRLVGAALALATLPGLRRGEGACGRAGAEQARLGHRPRPAHHRPAAGAVRSAGAVRRRHVQPVVELRQVLPRERRRRLLLPVLLLVHDDRLGPLRQAGRVPARRPPLLRPAGALLRGQRVLLEGRDLHPDLQVGRAAAATTSAAGRRRSASRRSSRARRPSACASPSARPAARAAASPTAARRTGSASTPTGASAAPATSDSSPAARSAVPRAARAATRASASAATSRRRSAPATAARRSAVPRARKACTDGTKTICCGKDEVCAQMADESGTVPASLNLQARVLPQGPHRRLRERRRDLLPAGLQVARRTLHPAGRRRWRSLLPQRQAVRLPGRPRRAAVRTPTRASTRRAATAPASRCTSTRTTAAAAAACATPASAAAPASASRCDGVGAAQPRPPARPRPHGP